MAKSNSQRLTEVHQKALEQFGRIQTALRPEREQCKEDRRFCSIPGAQWEGELADQYENKPKFEVNKVHLSVIRIINDYRNNKVEARFVPRKPDDDQLAELANGMFKADQHDSESIEAYDNAFEEAVMGGMGAFRLRNDYEDPYDEENEHQRVKIEPIYDADVTVYFDLDAKRQDKADAMHCFVLTSMTPEAYMDKYDDDPETWPNDLYTENFDWNTPEVVYVAEYYEVEEKSETKVFFETITGEEESHWLKDLGDDDFERFEAKGHTETRRRKIKRRKVRKYIMSGGGILEDNGYIAGREIPIVPVYGKRWYVENIERCMGHVRLAKDAQRLKNMQLSKLGEISALSSVEKPILTPEQVEGHEGMWSEDNIKDYPYLLVNPLTNEEGQTVAQGPIAYTKPSNIPPALAALLQITEDDMRDILGHHQQAEELRTHMSGSAVEQIHQRLDMQTYIYMSNFAQKSLRRCAEVWLSMAKDIYIEDGRDVKVMEGESEMGTKKIMMKKMGPEGMYVENNIEDADFDYFVDIGPSTVNQRDGVVRKVTQMMQYASDPMDQQVLSAIAMMNMEGDGMADFREYNRKKLVRMQVLQPTERDMQEMQMNPDEPSPQDKFALGEAERAEAEASKYRADTVETLANAELKKAQAQQIMVEMQQSMAPAPTDDGGERTFREEELLLKARLGSEDIRLKERELDLREAELKARGDKSE